MTPDFPFLYRLMRRAIRRALVLSILALLVGSVLA